MFTLLFVAFVPFLVASTAPPTTFDLSADNPVSYILGQQEDSALQELMNRRTDGRCGPGIGKCPDGYCCSTADRFGHCDAHQSPGGPPTDTIPRPKLGEVPYGPQTIRSCTIPGTIALTYDDGPHQYTSDLLDILDKHHAKATFFITGNNNGKGEIDTGEQWISLVQRMHSQGHQIASHTWSHQDLSKITEDQRRVQILWNEVALRNILGGFPTYMRPPYSSCTPESGCLNDIGVLGYHIILYDIDTEDYRHDSPDMIQVSKDIFDKNLARGKASDSSWLVITHDIHEQTVHNLTEHMLEKLSKDGYRAVTVGECLGDPEEFWYRNDDRVESHLRLRMPSNSSGAKIVSRDGVCGSGISCTGSSFGPCCSKNNRCGNSTAHCGDGCQPDSGMCSGSSKSDNSQHSGQHILSGTGKTALKSGVTRSTPKDLYAAGLILVSLLIFLA
ncbi:chitin deacetylase CDA6 [Aspergillus tanneri]|uniref:NodB homology domain-containing protein n=1 Tax=Aspergillus tanneri TaxID=1220188 RepID=A0A5M9MY80_9EURO|nr:uncharacterized protein ATNIH1004_003606 [Aspergillus tanneri]KAA8650916.1 hypothetical protein ATNIH1004_003606 [Aspergillus tanneri]